MSNPTAEQQLMERTGLSPADWWDNFKQHYVSPGIQAETLYLAIKARLHYEGRVESDRAVRARADNSENVAEGFAFFRWSQMWSNTWCPACWENLRAKWRRNQR